VAVTAPAACGWSAASNNGWLTVSPPGSAGNANVAFTAAANPDPLPRTGSLTVAGQTYTVTQPPAPCSYVLVPNSYGPVTSDGASGLSFTFTTTTPSGCAGSAVSYASWLTASTTWNDAQSGIVTYAVAQNLSGSQRTGTIQFGPQTFTVTQSKAACAYSLNAYGVLLNRLGGGGNVLASPSPLGCSAPNWGTDQPGFVTPLGPLAGPAFNIYTLPYTVAGFTTSLTAVTRKAKITIGGQVFSIKQTSW